MPSTDIIEQVEEEYGSYYTMKKISINHKIFVCAYRDQKIKAFVSSCSTTRLTGQRSFVGSGGNIVTISRPEVVEEYETHKSSVDAAENLRDNKTSYRHVISTERWEIHYFDGNMSHTTFKDILAFTLLKHCKELIENTHEDNSISRMRLRNDSTHFSLKNRPIWAD
ncbi:hypothetical protein INT48_005401 [Thamnidium elegans]|uniref:PiggyBac transposable element-derived protein domain-containing protein n=1 Tax=Thamnidium elegans TaxID=101142 RepID=A0A8H7SKI6_9FUNG|nr:hypothetical protein INT48_005401 [Thamnidium elegans]